LSVIERPDDAGYLVEATRGLDVLLWITPPGYGSDDVRGYQNRLGRAVANAVRTNGIPRVVNLSSLGADHEFGVGPICGLHDVEYLLDGAAPNITHLRPGFFFENLLWQFEEMRDHGRISFPLGGMRRYPMIATRDIGLVAARQLISRSWTGRIVMELHGPADLSFDEVAEILSREIGRKITYVRCTAREAHSMMINAGLSENAADLMVEMFGAVQAGTLRPSQPRSPQTTTTTTLVEFAHEVLIPKFAVPVSH